MKSLRLVIPSSTTVGDLGHNVIAQVSDGDVKAVVDGRFVGGLVVPDVDAFL